jgi:hypothetical protein
VNVNVLAASGSVILAVAAVQLCVAAAIAMAVLAVRALR